MPVPGRRGGGRVARDAGPAGAADGRYIVATGSENSPKNPIVGAGAGMRFQRDVHIVYDIF